MIDDVQDVKHVSTLREIADQVFYAIRLPLTMKLQAALALLAGEPFTKRCFYSCQLQLAIDNYLDENDVSAVLCFCSPSAEYIFRSRHYQKKLKGKILLTDLVDVDSEKWRQYAEHKSGLMRWLYQREAEHLLPYEQKIAESFDRTFLVSEEEKEVLAQYGNVEKIEAMSNGVDLDFFTPKIPPEGGKGGLANRLVFSGAMDYWPNIDGAVWFADKVFPEVLKAFPDAVFCIAGRNPDETVQTLGKRAGIEVTGTVPDIRECLHDAALCVAPLQIARGIQNKVLEGMAMGKTVVATPGAATGLKAVPNEEIVVAKDATQMAEVIICLLDAPQMRYAIGENARRYVEREHSWAIPLRRLGELVDAGKDASGC
jgi:sugar transferase (PEP-CTERM/EpsH1 system associated)